MFSVGIIVSSWHYFANPFKLQPLNELYFATIIDKRLNVNLDVIDLRDARLPESSVDLNKLDGSISEHDVFFYWIAKSADSQEYESIVRQLRLAYPDSIHAAGGTHVDNFPSECGNIFDAVILGPGEESFIKIIEDIKCNSLQKEYRGDWQKSIYDDYPVPRRDYLPERSIVNTELFKKYGSVRGTSVMFSRGCNFKCAYCVYNVPCYIQRRSSDSIKKEINYLKKEYNLNAINMRDEIAIPLSRKESTPFIDTMAEMDIIWRGQTRVGLDKEILEKAEKSGCVELAVGVESASQQVLDIIHKGQTVEQAEKFIIDCHDVGIKVKMCLILGLPGEPDNIVDVTYDFINKIKPDYVNVSGFCPVPGSRIFKERAEYGIKYIDEDWSHHAHLVYRFSDKEHFGLPFEYYPYNKWGKTFTRKEIVSNICEIQQYLKDNMMSY